MNCQKIINPFSIQDLNKSTEQNKEKLIIWKNLALLESKINILKNLPNEIKTHISHTQNPKIYDLLHPHNFNIRLQLIDQKKHFLSTTQTYVSPSLKHFEERFMKKYNLKPYQNINEQCFFFGIYLKKDREKMNRHKGTKYIIWGGTDINFKYAIGQTNREMLEHQSDKNPPIHLAISEDISNRLSSINVQHYRFDLDLVDYSIFKPPVKYGPKVFIYNGYSKGNTKLYGHNIYKQVMKELPQFQYMLSNTLHVPNNKMPDIYKQCFIGLRLTPRDGNANSVQEMKAMGIPVVHNQSEYGLKWKTVEDVKNYIIKFNGLRNDIN